MIAFVNTFITYLILCLLSIAIIVAAVICGKKLREMKDEKDAQKAVDAAGAEEEKEN